MLLGEKKNTQIGAFSSANFVEYENPGSMQTESNKFKCSINNKSILQVKLKCLQSFLVILDRYTVGVAIRRSQNIQSRTSLYKRKSREGDILKESEFPTSLETKVGQKSICYSKLITAFLERHSEWYCLDFYT